MTTPLFRIGLGQDSHRLLESTRKQDQLTLAGLQFDCGFTFAADSDGDVIIHALCNALASAIGGGSLGTVATKLCEQGIRDSSEYLKIFLQQVATANYQLSNVSVSVEALQPKLEKYRPLLQKNLARLCALEPNQVGITFTTGDNLTQAGQGQGIAVLVTVLLYAH